MRQRGQGDQSTGKKEPDRPGRAPSSVQGQGRPDLRARLRTEGAVSEGDHLTLTEATTNFKENHLILSPRSQMPDSWELSTEQPTNYLWLLRPQAGPGLTQALPWSELAAPLFRRGACVSTSLKAHWLLLIKICLGFWR